MELPVLDKFCFVFNLRTGCIFMGILNSVLSFLLHCLLISFSEDIRRTPEAVVEGAMSSVVYVIVILLVILLLLKCLLDLILVYAVYKERRYILKNYCIFWIVFLVLFIIGFLKTLFHMDAGYVIAMLLFLAENFYYICVIRSYLISFNEDGVL